MHTNDCLSFRKGIPIVISALFYLTRGGVSVGGIRNALKEIGMESATFEMTTEQLRDNCPLPRTVESIHAFS